MPSASDISQDNPLDWIQREILSVLQRWESETDRSYWKPPLVNIADADDELFAKLKEVVDPSHALPRDLLPGVRSVVVFFLPFEEAMGKENADTLPFASRRWAMGYVDTNQVIARICEHLKTLFAQAGHESAVTPATHNFDEEKLISRWSHKHLGFIAGLGTFGHHHQLITRSGCVGRLGSLVTSAPLPPTPRPGTEWCLRKRGRECLACVAKCRFGALKKDGFDRHQCYSQCLATDNHFGDLPLVDVCGKCACEVPCSYSIPS